MDVAPDSLGDFDHEGLHLFNDRDTGLLGAIAVHSRALGPAMGGVRLTAYPGVGPAARDALRLARGMSLKSAVAGLALGGGKATLVDDGAWSDPHLRRARMEAFGARIDSLGGDYVTAEDVGTTPADMDAIAERTRWVAGRPVASGGRGDPAAATARTVVAAIRAAAAHTLGSPDLAGVRVAVIGVGSVGGRVARGVAAEGAEVVVGDVDDARAAAVAAAVAGRAAPAGELLGSDVDIVSPCALGSVLGAAEAGLVQAAAIAGAANDQLVSPSVADQLHAAGVLYVPDFLANCGGIVHVGAEVLGLDDDAVETLLGAAEARVDAVLTSAEAEATTPWRVAVAEARARIAEAPHAVPAEVGR